MRKLAFVLAVLLVGIMPFAASAQQTPPRPPAAPQQVAEGVTVGKLLTIAAGVVLGAVVLDAIAFGDAAVIVGGVAGGFLGAWWYDNGGSDALTRTGIRQAAMPVSVQANPI